MNAKQKALATMKALTFGIEIETVGRREDVAAAIHSVTGGQINRGYSVSVTAPDGRTWKVVRDGSVTGGGAEIVSPILRWDDMEQLQEIVRAVRTSRAGRIDHSCGIHIHLGAQSFDSKALGRLVKTVRKQEQLIYAAVGVTNDRQSRWARPVTDRVVAAAEAGADLNGINRAVYGRQNDRPMHYDHNRYHGLNLHNVFFRGTVEFRLFDATLHAGKVKAMVQFCLALGAKAINGKSASAKRRPYNAATAKYDFRVFLLSLGLIGTEFKTCRLHMLSRLAGDSAFQNGRRSAAA